MFLVEPDKLDIKDTYRTWFSIYHALVADLTAKDSKDSDTNETQTQFCLNLLTSRMRDEVNR